MQPPMRVSTQHATHGGAMVGGTVLLASSFPLSLVHLINHTHTRGNAQLRAQRCTTPWPNYANHANPNL